MALATLFAQNTINSGMLMLAGVGICCWVLLRRRFGRRSRGTSGSSSATASRFSPKKRPFRRPESRNVPSRSADNFPGEIHNWKVEMYELAEALTAKLDNKIRILDVMTAEANRAVDRLEAASRRDARYEGAVLEESALTEGGATPSDPFLGPRPSVEACLETIYLFADYGFPTREIARRTGLDTTAVTQALQERSTVRKEKIC